MVSNIAVPAARDAVGMQADGTGAGEEHPETWTLLNEELRLRLDAQRTAFTRLEGRAAIVLAASFTAVQFVAREPVSSAWLLWALIAYAVSMLTALVAVWPRRFEELKPRSLVYGLWLYPAGRASAELANARLVAFEVNVNRQARLVCLVRISVILALLGAIMSAAHLKEGHRNDGRDPRPSCIAASPPAPGSGSCRTGP